MKHSKEEVMAFMWMQWQFYKAGLLVREQIAMLEAIDGWTWDDSEEAAPTIEMWQRVMQKIKNSCLSFHRLSPAQMQSFERIFRDGVASPEMVVTNGGR